MAQERPTILATEMSDPLRTDLEQSVSVMFLDAVFHSSALVTTG